MKFINMSFWKIIAIILKVSPYCVWNLVTVSIKKENKWLEEGHLYLSTKKFPPDAWQIKEYPKWKIISQRIVIRKCCKINNRFCRNNFKMENFVSEIIEIKPLPKIIICEYKTTSR